MRQYIKNLQQKDESVRKQILVASVAVSMIIIGSLWIYSLGARFDTTVAEQVNTDVKPFKLFGDSVSSTIHNISASVGSISFSKKDEATPKKQVKLIPIDTSKQ